MSLVATFDDVQVEYQLQPKRDGVFSVVNLDYDQQWGADFDNAFHVSRNTRNRIPYGAISGKAVPATCRFKDDTFLYMTCEIQYWLHALSSERSPQIPEARRKQDFRSLYRANAYITNNAGTDNRQDCVNGTGEGKGLPQFQPMVTGGTLLKIVDETSKEYLIEAINPNVSRDYRPETHLWLFYPPTISARYWINEEKKNLLDYNNDNHPDKITPKQEWYNEPFHYYAENTILPVVGFIPNGNSSTGFVNRVDKFRVRLLGLSEPVPNPFVMRFGRAKQNPYKGF